MITKEIISRLKRTDVSKDEEKTMFRVKNEFLPLRNKQKAEIIELTGLKRTSIYRVFREGSISAKIALAMAQCLNITPYYFTGETDEKDPLTDALAVSFLNEKGYKVLAERLMNQITRTNKQPAPAAPQPNALLTSAFTNSPELSEAASYLREEDAVTLLRGLLIRGRVGGEAAQVADIVKRCLFS